LIFNLRNQNLFWFLGSILRPSPFSIAHSCTVQNTANNMVANPRKIWHPSPANHDNGVFLQIVADSGDIGGHFHSISEPDSCDFSQGRIGLFGSNRRNLDAHPALERSGRFNRAILERVETPRQSRRFGFFLLDFSGPFFELVYGWHYRNNKNG